MNTVIIGCGGVASYFIPPYLKTIRHAKSRDMRNHHVTLVDGDVLEEKNLQRQLFDPKFVGRPKVEALIERYKPEYENLSCVGSYITDTFSVHDNSCIFGFVDNHPARKDILAIADRTDSIAIFGANSEVGAEAYIYIPEWKGTALDPRVRFPEMLTIDRGSPVHAAGCETEEHLDEAPQTPIANMHAAAHAMLIWNFWYIERHELDEALSGQTWPVSFVNTATTKYPVTVGALKNAA